MKRNYSIIKADKIRQSSNSAPSN